MEDVSGDYKDKPVRHTLDKKAFRRYSIRLVLWPFAFLLLQVPVFMIDKEQELLSFASQVGLPMLAFVIPFFTFLNILFTLKSSDIFTVPGCVLYRKRRLISTQFDGVRYIVYHIANVKSVNGGEKHPTVVKGKINAVYVLDDGNTIHSFKTCRKVTIPPCFTEMETIRKTLEDMED